MTADDCLAASQVGTTGVVPAVGGLGIVGGLAIMLLVVAAVPFAVLTGWSVATPLIGILLIAIGILALKPHQHSAATPTRAVKHELA